MATSTSPTTATDNEIDDLLSKASVWLGKAMNELNNDAPINVTSAKCRQLGKESLVSLFCDAFQLVRFQNDRLRQTRSQLNTTRSDLVNSQKHVIHLQQHVIASKEQSMISVTSAVTESVSETVKAEIRSYSDVLKESCSETQLISSDALKSALKCAVQEEDRSKHLMVFGLPEEENENLKCKVGEVFTQLGVKPVTESCRVGKTGNMQRPRPVKVSLCKTGQNFGRTCFT